MKKRIIFYPVILIFIVTGLIACSGKNPYAPDYSLVPAPYDTVGAPRTVTSDGLIYYDIVKGYGQFQVVANDQVTIDYTGRIKKSGKIFDSTYEKSRIGIPYTVSVAGLSSSGGSFSLIRGFREGLLGMRVGGKRTIVIPPDLGYGGTSSSMANDTLIFDVKLDGISQ